MKIEHSRTLDFFDVDHNSLLKVESAARFFQDIAIRHSSRVGAGPEVLFPRGMIWLLHRLEIEFFRYPLLGEKVKVSTWTRGIFHHKSLREYCIESLAGTVAKASSVWIFYDFKRKKIIKVPGEIKELYRFKHEDNFDDELSDWNPGARITPEREIKISLRYADFDINGHVNNTVYLGLIETLFHQTLANKHIRHLKIRFGREIGTSVSGVRAGWQKEDGVYRFNIMGGDQDSSLHSDGQFTLMG